MNLEGETLLQIKNGGMPFFMTSENLYQQTKSGHHTNHSEQNITTYITLYSQQTHILNFPQQKKTIIHSQEHSEFILLNIKPSHHQKYQHCMSKLLHG